MNWMRFRPVYFLISGLSLTLSLYAILVWGFRPSIDFTGGTVVEYRAGDEKQTFRFGPDFTSEDAQSFAGELEDEFEKRPEVLRFEQVGPAFSQEILRKTYVAAALAAAGILLWVAWQFKSLQFGVSAILAMLHDTFILLGVFAILGYYLGIEVDILFVTAVLTTLSFSVHDTIVVYDRIRESSKRFSDISMYDLANKAVSETMVRSLNNSLTIIFMLFALFLMGGETIKWFVFALLVGTIAGTYSSPFVAVPLLVTWARLSPLQMRQKLFRLFGRR